MDDPCEHQREQLRVRWARLRETTESLTAASRLYVGSTDARAMQRHTDRINQHRRELEDFRADLAAFHRRCGESPNMDAQGPPEGGPPNRS